MSNSSQQLSKILAELTFRQQKQLDSLTELQLKLDALKKTSRADELALQFRNDAQRLKAEFAGLAGFATTLSQVYIFCQFPDRPHILDLLSMFCLRMDSPSPRNWLTLLRISMPTFLATLTPRCIRPSSFSAVSTGWRRSHLLTRSGHPTHRRPTTISVTTAGYLATEDCRRRGPLTARWRHADRMV